jgi:hypothetical protein
VVGDDVLAELAALDVRARIEQRATARQAQDQRVAIHLEAVTLALHWLAIFHAAQRLRIEVVHEPRLRRMQAAKLLHLLRLDLFIAAWIVVHEVAPDSHAGAVVEAHG